MTDGLIGTRAVGTLSVQIAEANRPYEYGGWLAWPGVSLCPCLFPSAETHRARVMRRGGREPAQQHGTVSLKAPAAAPEPGGRGGGRCKAGRETRQDKTRRDAGPHVLHIARTQLQLYILLRDYQYAVRSKRGPRGTHSCSVSSSPAFPNLINLGAWEPPGGLQQVQLPAAVVWYLNLCCRGRYLYLYPTLST